MYVDKDCQQIYQFSSKKRLNRSENISKRFRGYFFETPCNLQFFLGARVCFLEAHGRGNACLYGCAGHRYIFYFGRFTHLDSHCNRLLRRNPGSRHDSGWFLFRQQRLPKI